MEYYLIDYLIDEGYANTESSAYKILSVISEEFYEYLLSEALTPEERERRRRENRARRIELGIAGRSDDEKLERLLKVAGRRTTGSGGQVMSRTMETHTGANIPEREKKHTDEITVNFNRATKNLKDDRKTKEGRENEAKKPTKMPTAIGADGKPMIQKSQDIGADNTQELGGKRGRGDIRSAPVQSSNSTRRQVWQGSGGSFQSYGDNPSGSTGAVRRGGTTQKKPQTSQPQVQRTTPSGRPVRVRQLPTQQPTRATTARRKPETPTPNPSTSPRKLTQQELEIQNRTTPTNPSMRASRSTATKRRIGAGSQQFLGIKRQNPQ